MKNYKEQILKLRKDGKSYRQIYKIVGCAKSLVTYYCSDNQKEKSRIRQARRRNKIHPYQKKIETFCESKKKYIKKYINKYKKIEKIIYTKLWTFSCRGIYTMLSVNDVIKKFGENPICYLTGKKIDIYKSKTYHFDHIVPRSKGGNSDIDNLGLTTKEANVAKSNLTLSEFVQLCKDVLENFGYQIIKSDSKITDKGIEPIDIPSHNLMSAA